ncbi:MAG: sigma-70 family RNA polymerase sigma factor [Phycisphaerae bacterium]|nr:sigma-70 family RNA polymerase sigma factor [Phycisphaerae bacterium]
MDRQALADLIRRMQRRDETAFDALVEHFGGRLYGFLYRLTGSRDDAEELAQETLVRVVRMIGRYTDDGRFEGWLFRIAANLARDRARRMRRVPGRVEWSETDGLRDGGPGLTGDQPGPDARMETREDVDRMNAALAKLPDGEREVILMRHFSNMSFREIAAAMQTPLGTALARAHRGLLRLRSMLESDETGPGRAVFQERTS